jgi:uracil-DNA glycosylase
MIADQALHNQAERRSRLRSIDEPHIAPLTAFVQRLREETGHGLNIPYFDPLDGGVHARCLVIAEAPGPRAVESGFISRDNPDQSARNTRLAHAAAGIPRAETALWNIVPWYIGGPDRIRPAEGEDTRAGLPHLLHLTGLLQRLEVIVLAGRKAARVTGLLEQRLRGIRFFETPHPSPLFVNAAPENFGRLISSLRRAAVALGYAGTDDGDAIPPVIASSAAATPPRPRDAAQETSAPVEFAVTPAAPGDADEQQSRLRRLLEIVRDRGVVLRRGDERDAAAIEAAIAALPEPVVSRSTFSGKRIVRARGYQNGGNPRQADSHGYRAYELIPLGDHGVRFEDLLARIRRLPAKSSKEYGAGGTNHIKWDLDHGHTYLIDDRSGRFSGRRPRSSSI